MLSFVKSVEICPHSHDHDIDGADQTAPLQVEDHNDQAVEDDSNDPNDGVTEPAQVQGVLYQRLGDVNRNIAGSLLWVHHCIVQINKLKINSRCDSMKQQRF